MQFPIERLRKLAADKVIATVASEYVGFMGRSRSSAYRSRPLRAT